MARSKTSRRKPRFALEAQVRVKRGVSDPDCPLMPLGGWAGTVIEVNNDDRKWVMYLIRWSDETLNKAHSIYRIRCHRGGLDETCMWLDEGSIEADHGPPLPMEQPTPAAIRSVLEQDDRVKDALGISRDDPLPLV